MLSEISHVVRRSLVALLVLVLAAAMAHGTTFTVTTTDDHDDGTCTEDCTLREAINAANGGAGQDTIVFALSGTILLGSTLPSITDATGLTLDGTGQSVTISGNHAVRVLEIATGAALSLFGLTIADGSAASSGAGVFNAGALTVTNCTVSGHAASSGANGGGIWNSGMLTVTNTVFASSQAHHAGALYNASDASIGNSRFSGNFASSQGGGIWNAGTLTVADTTFSGNSALQAGGGIINVGGLEITGSTFSENSGGSGGGGIHNNGTVTVGNSTFSGNSAGGGGGINNFQTLTVVNSTFSTNSASTGGGIASPYGTTTLSNTLVANNPSGGNCSGAITDGGGNLDDGASCGFTAPSSQSNATAGLDPAGLQDNGGPTQTIALVAGSQAIDTGVQAICDAAPVGNLDQRGATRPFDGDQNGSSVCDVGALESGPQPGPAVVVNTLADHDDGVCSLFDCTLREAMEVAFGDGAPTTITFAPALAGGVIHLASGLPPLTHEDGTTIDGDLGGDCVPDIALDGSALSDDNSIVLWSAGNTVRGLAIYGFPSCGHGGEFGITGATAIGNVVECNWIGVDLSGAERPGQCLGLRIGGGASDNRVERNRITGAEAWGIFLQDGGLPGYPDFTGLTPDLLQEVGTLDLADDCQFFKVRGGGAFSDAGGHPFNENFGMRLTGSVSILQEGDYIFSLPGLDDQGRLFVKDETLIDWPGGGTPPPAVKHLEAGSHPIRLEYAERGGVAILTLAVSGPQPVSFSTDGNTAGCSAAHPSLCGEFFQLRVPSERNRITRNSLWNNGTGIGTNCCCGPAVNDPDDLDLGPNTLLNHPVVASITSSGTPGSYLVSGTAPPNATVELFVAWMNPSFTLGQGQEYLGSLTADGTGSFSGTIPIPLWKNHIVATATDAVGNTSEFSAPLLVTDNTDDVTVGGGGTALPDSMLEVPIYVRDQSLTLLGRDRPAGERIQGLAFKVSWTPASAITAAHFERDGITAALTPDFENNTQAGNTASYVAFFVESTNPIPFTLDTANTVAKLVLTVAPNAPPGPVTLTLDPVTTLENQAGTIEETEPGGTLTLTSGSLTVESNAATQLLARPESSSSIRLHWWDPNRNEIGFRVERSPDGSSWAPVGTAGPDDMTFLDSGLPPSTLFYYRLVTLVAGGDSQVTPNAAGSTYAAVAARICTSQLSGPRSFVQQSSVAWNGSEWGAVYSAQSDGLQPDLRFQRLAAADLSPIGGPVTLVTSDMTSNLPMLRWNGSHYGLLWNEGMRAEPGPGAGTSGLFFALLNPDGTKARGDVPIPNPFGGWLTSNAEWAFGWDGTHWGLFLSLWNPQPFTKLVYYRIDEDGDTVLGPVDVTTTSDHQELDHTAAFAPEAGVWGLAWNRYLDGASEIWFQRVEESDGTPVGAPVSLGTWSGSADGIAIAWDSTTPPDGAWVVVWSEYLSDGSEGPLMLRKVASDGNVLGTTPTRLSDDADPEDPKWDESPVVVVTASGEVRAFTWSADNTTGSYEVGMLRADGAGNRLGNRALMTPIDGFGIQYPHVAGHGDEQAVLFRDPSSGAWEISGLRVDASGNPSAPLPLTSGNTVGAASMAPTGLAPLGSGFVALWSDRLTSNPSELATIRGRIVDGSGATVTDLAPLTSTPVNGQPALVTLGNEFAVAWRDATTPGGVIRFARYGASGNPLTGEAIVATGTSTPVVIGFDGERYGVVYRKSGSWRFVSVWPDGTLSGSERTLYSDITGQTPVLLWVGSGWALVWRHWPDSALHFGLFDRDGLYAPPSVPLTGPAVASLRTQFTAATRVGEILVAWTENLGTDPPGNDIYFAMFGRGGEILVPPTIAVSSPYGESAPRVVWDNGTFHLFYTGGEAGWVHEIEIDPAGNVLPGVRWWTNRGNAAAIAGNGATRALVWGQGELFLETGACVADTTRPPCPTLAAASLNHKVRLDWSPVDDSDSGIWRYDLYRDGRMLAELFASTTHFDDGGTFPTTTHLYELRAMNGAFLESGSCPALSFSTLRGDANGNGAVEISDIFYLINYMLAGGPPPAGDADCNGSGGVTVGDIFYLINFFYGGGPPPVWSGETRMIEAAATADDRAAVAARIEIADEVSGEAKHPVSTLALGKAVLGAGSTVIVPVTLVDATGTPLGEDRGSGNRLQALALAVRVLPASAVTRVEVRRAGVLAGLTPLFESTPSTLDGVGLVTVFDEAATPLSWTAPRIRLRDGGLPVAEIVLTLSETAASAPGGRVELRLDPATTLLSNQAGTVTETAANGWLRLVDGAVEIRP